MGTINQSGWNALFSSLAAAEKGAADECIKISKKFRSIGLTELADKYESLAIEENRHHQLALLTANELIPISDKAKIIYEGGYFTEDGPIIERLMTVHLVFEPSALAFLGFISSHANDLVGDQKWADQIKKSFNAILLDEVDHVYSGEKLIRQFWKRSTAAERSIATKTMRKHRAFLKAGLKSFFKNESSEKEVISKMLARFDFYYEKALKGALHADAA